MKGTPQECVSERIVEQIFDKSVLHVVGAERQGFSKSHNKLRTKIVLDPDWIQQRTVEQTAKTHVQQVANTVEVKTLKIIKMTTQGKKLDPDEDQSNKDQSRKKSIR